MSNKVPMDVLKVRGRGMMNDYSDEEVMKLIESTRRETAIAIFAEMAKYSRVGYNMMGRKEVAFPAKVFGEIINKYMKKGEEEK